MQQPLLTKDLAVVVTEQNLYGLNIMTGTERWKYRLHGYLLALPLELHRDLIIVGEEGGVVSALNVNTGNLEWQQDIISSNPGYINGIVVINDLVVVVGQPPVISALSIDDGQVQWDLAANAQTMISRAAFITAYNKRIYILDQNTYVLDPESGRVEGTLAVDLRGFQQVDNLFFDTTGVYDITRPALTLEPLVRETSASACASFYLPYTIEQHLIIGAADCGGIYAIEQTGEIRWEYRPDLLGSPPLAVFHGNVYALLDNGEIHAIAMESGVNHGVLTTSAPLAEYSVGGDLTSRGVTTNGEVIVVTFNEPTVLGLGLDSD